MNGNILDTSVIIDVLRGDPGAIVFVGELGEDVFVSAITIGELLYGAKKSADIVHNTDLIYRMTDAFEVLSVDMETAEVYGEIKIDLNRKGYKLPENDIWIAATAKKHGLSLATFDSDFQRIDDLKIKGVEK